MGDAGVIRLTWKSARPGFEFLTNLCLRSHSLESEMGIPVHVIYQGNSLQRREGGKQDRAVEDALQGCGLSEI